MKKIFSLMAAVLFAGSMMADFYSPVTDASALSNGDRIIITSADATYALGSTQNNNNRAAVAVTLENGVIVPGEDVQTIVLESSGEHFMLSVGEDAYLYAASNSSNHLKTANAETVGDNGKFAITIDEEGIASVIAQGANTRNNLRYNPNTQNNNPLFSCYAASSSVAAGLKIFKQEGGEVEPVEEYYLTGSIREWAQTADAAYKFKANTAAAGEYILKGIELSAEDEIKVIGILGETVTWYPGGSDNNYVVAEDGEYDIYFRPAGEGGEDWHEGCIYLQEVLPPTAITCSAVYDMAKNDVVGLLNDVTVTYVNGKYVWVKDASASLLLYLSANATWEAGDVLSGVAGVVDIYNGVYEVKPSAEQVAAVVATAGEAPAAEVVTELTTADMNKYIVMKNVAVDGEFEEGTASNITIGGITVRNQFKNGFAFDAEKLYDVYGVVTVYQNNPQVYFITAEEAAETAIDNTSAAIKAVKVVREGKLFIEKNGVLYNAQGAVVR